MIVKDESSVIEKCLKSVSEIIDYWIIVDTGSSDGTPEIIEKFMKELHIPGELHRKEWKSFDVNRNESLSLAKSKCDYTLVIDADDYLQINDQSTFNNLNADAYKIELNLENLIYHRIQLFKSDYDWKYEGVLHEYLKIPNINGYREELLGGVKMIAKSSKESGSKDYQIDAKILYEEIEKEGLSLDLKNRYQFYLAQSLKDGGDLYGAIKWFEKRANSGGWPEEIYVSLWMIAKLKKELNFSEEAVINAYLKAWEFRPSRSEALFELAQMLYNLNRTRLAYILIKDNMKMYPDLDSLFVDVSIKQWRMNNLYSQIAYSLGYLNDAIYSCEILINSSTFTEIPKEEQVRIMHNFELYEMSLIGN